MDKIERLVLDRAKEYYGVDTDAEAREEVIAEWGVYGLRGYGIFSESTVAEHIERIDVFGVYDSDIAAARQAKIDGVKLIPWAEQPKRGSLRYCRFIDTEENRRVLAKQNWNIWRN